MQSPDNATIAALDVGSSRIGVGIANLIARLPRPYDTLIVSDHVMHDIEQIVETEQVGMLVIGLPRNLAGEETQQTQNVRDFAARLATQLSIPLYFQDEALTSRKAEDELTARKRPYRKGDIDALAATYILDDFLKRTNPEEARI